jgi:hypothetical protein
MVFHTRKRIPSCCFGVGDRIVDNRSDVGLKGVANFVCMAKTSYFIAIREIVEILDELVVEDAFFLNRVFDRNFVDDLLVRHFVEDGV